MTDPSSPCCSSEKTLIARTNVVSFLDVNTLGQCDFESLAALVQVVASDLSDEANAFLANFDIAACCSRSAVVTVRRWTKAFRYKRQIGLKTHAGAAEYVKALPRSPVPLNAFVVL